MYNQGDFPSRKINGTKYTLATDGCFIFSLAELCHKHPLEVLEILEKGGGLNGALIKSRKVAELLGLTLDGIDAFGATNTEPNFRCIAKVDFNINTSAKEIHFVVWNPDGTMDDPWGGIKRKEGHYKILEWRLWHEINTSDKTMDKYFMDELSKICKRDFGSNLNESEQKEAGEKLKEYRNNHEQLVEYCAKAPKEVVVEKPVDRIVYKDTLKTLEQLDNANKDIIELKKEIAKRNALYINLQEIKEKLFSIWNNITTKK